MLLKLLLACYPSVAGCTEDEAVDGAYVCVAGEGSFVYFQGRKDYRVSREYPTIYNTFALLGSCVYNLKIIAVYAQV
ncbi:hypothetical protein [Methanolobus sp.]|uniref:hypothetical protein n=1 Tax=Methanolobus sp. TaxID=1874737 RepID=UPI00260125DF|nr:hypothetical protein [Methanolobus sp.]